MKNQPPIAHTLAIIILSLLILAVVIQFAPSAQAPDKGKDTLTTRVAAATVIPSTVVSPTRVAVANPPAFVEPRTASQFLFFSADRDGYRELYAATRDSISDTTKWRQLTAGYAPAKAPALSPDGGRLAFQSRKNGNWEIYVLDLENGEIDRLTNDLSYDGAPSWSPDGREIAFESYRGGDLDIWKMAVDGRDLENLTADQSAYDFSPAWSPDGKMIVFTSWAAGNKQLYVMAPDGSGLRNLSDDRFHNEQAAWSPDGKRIVFVSNREGCAETVEATLEHPPLQGAVPSGNCQRRGVFVADLVGTTAANARLENLEQLSFFGWDSAPAWSPDGAWITFVSARPARSSLFVAASDGAGIAQGLNDDRVWISSAVWSGLDTLRTGTAPVVQPPLYIEKPIPADPAEGVKWDFVGLREVLLSPSYGIVSSAVSESFRALRNRVVSESGVDFLAQLSDMTRLITYVCDNTCDTLSWHKSGRAVDTLLTLVRGDRETVLLVREDVNAEVHWRVYLRAAKQDGSQGEPLTEAPWNISFNARANAAPGLGGHQDEVAYGYFVDFTELARQYGWNRISSHDDIDFDWRNNREALEYWHFQKEDGLNWWQAMLEVYPPDQLAKTFDWQKIVDELKRPPSRTYLKDVPPAPNAWKWFALIPR
ncbi:MAG: PD40 domain-containing protein [Anaerolineae bacterium]|nr:PD40 domain-containing protein [Anaerolineae bacterium]